MPSITKTQGPQHKFPAETGLSFMMNIQDLKTKMGKAAAAI